MSKLDEKKRRMALASGYPFENEVYDVLQKVFSLEDIKRNFEFPCINEEGNEIIRSVDFLCSMRKNIYAVPHPHWNLGKNDFLEITFIIDAKYSHDEIYMFHQPYSSNEQFRWPSLIPVLINNASGPMFRNDLFDLGNMDLLQLVGIGRKVTEKGDRDSVSSAALQIIQGMTHVINDHGGKIGAPTGQSGKHYRNAHLFIPIVVTNSSLLFLKDGIQCKTIQDAQLESEIFDERDLIALRTPQMYRLIQTLHSAKSVLRYSKNNLKWHEEGIHECAIIYCNPIGLQQFLNTIKNNVEILSPKSSQF